LTYVQRQIFVTFTLGHAASFQGGGNTLKLSGLRISAAVTNSGGISQGALDLRIYGMTPSQMNSLMVVGPVPLVIQANNNVLIEVNNDIDPGTSQVFSGTIASAWPDFSDAPDVPFHVTSLVGLAGALKPVPPSSYQGGRDAAEIMKQIATTMGFKFENNGVSVQLSNSYFPGTGWQQAEACADAAGINWTVDRGVLAIWPRGGARGGSVPLISPDTGLVGYPIRTPLGVELQTLYNPAIVHGSKVKVQSSLQQANGVWQVTTLDHTLESMVPDGQWFSHLTCLPVGFIA